jgi:hypothetical protein
VGTRWLLRPACRVTCQGEPVLVPSGRTVTQRRTQIMRAGSWETHGDNDDDGRLRDRPYDGKRLGAAGEAGRRGGDSVRSGGVGYPPKRCLGMAQSDEDGQDNARPHGHLSATLVLVPLPHAAYRTLVGVEVGYQGRYLPILHGLAPVSASASASCVYVYVLWLVVTEPRTTVFASPPLETPSRFHALQHVPC